VSRGNADFSVAKSNHKNCLNTAKESLENVVDEVFRFGSGELPDIFDNHNFFTDLHSIFKC